MSREETEALAREGDAVALARVLVSTPSVNPDIESGGAGEREIAGICALWLEGWGFDVAVSEPAEGRANVVARLGGGERRLLLNGHLDTVGVDGMTIPPFEADVVAGRLRGRGSCDMKGGVAALLAAAARLAAAEELGGELIVALTADEENASVGMAALVEAGLAAKAAVVCEPTSLAVMPAHKGFLWVGVDFRGRAAHGSRPDEGIDAIRHAGVVLAGLDAHEEGLRRRRAHPLLGHGSIHAGTIRGGSAPSVYPEACHLVLERRTLPGERDDEVMRELDDLLAGARTDVPGLDAELHLDLSRPGTEVGTESELVRSLVAACREEGIEGRIEGMTAWVDAAFLNESGTPAVCFGPGSIAQAHSADEWIDVGEIEACARILTRFGERFLAGGDEEE